MTRAAIPRKRRLSGEHYFALVESGQLGPDDRVELLEGVIVGMAPQSPQHASATGRVADALRCVFEDRAVIRLHSPWIAGADSVPEPDVTVVPGGRDTYDTVHPTRALLIVEVADSSVAQDRLTKAAIYAASGAPEYWIVNLRDRCLEVHREPDVARRRYAWRAVANVEDFVSPLAAAEARIAVSELLPNPVSA